MDLCRTGLCKNPRKSASLPCPFKHTSKHVKKGRPLYAKKIYKVLIARHGYQRVLLAFNVNVYKWFSWLYSYYGFTTFRVCLTSFMVLLFLFHFYILYIIGCTVYCTVLIKPSRTYSILYLYCTYEYVNEIHS